MLCGESTDIMVDEREDCTPLINQARLEEVGHTRRPIILLYPDRPLPRRDLRLPLSQHPHPLIIVARLLHAR